MELRGAPRGRDVTDTQAETILHAVLDAGINYIDTSIDYGVSEERIGRYIGDRRSEYYLASKCGCLVGAPPAPRGQTGTHVFTRDNILAGVEQSLTRMRTDYLTWFSSHSPYIAPPRRMRAGDRPWTQRAGTIRFAGVRHLPTRQITSPWAVFAGSRSLLSGRAGHDSDHRGGGQAGPASSFGAAPPRARPQREASGVQWKAVADVHPRDLLDGMRPWRYPALPFNHNRTCTRHRRTITSRPSPAQCHVLRQARCQPITPKPQACLHVRVQSASDGTATTSPQRKDYLRYSNQ